MADSCHYTACAKPLFFRVPIIKFDSPYMALSILVAVVPVLFIKNFYFFITATVISTVIICTSYQASIGILPMVTVFSLLTMYINGETLKNLFKTTFYFAIAFLAGAIIFKTLILQPTVRDYVSIDIAPFDILPNLFVKNMAIYYSDLFSKSGFIGSSAICKKTIIITTVVMLIVCVFNSKNNKLLTLLLAALSLTLGAILTYGFYACLEKPLFIPRALYGIGVLLACIFTIAVSYKEFFIAKICSVILGWYLIVTASSYGNALVAQKNWEKFRAEEVVIDLASIDEGRMEGRKFKVEGNCGLSPSLSYLTIDRPIFKRLIPQTLGQEFWFWNEPQLSYAYGISELTYDNEITDNGTPLIVRETRFHTIKVFEDKLIIKLKQ